jgi:hypothetical protein
MPVVAGVALAPDKMIVRVSPVAAIMAFVDVRVAARIRAGRVGGNVAVDDLPALILDAGGLDLVEALGGLKGGDARFVQLRLFTFSAEAGCAFSLGFVKLLRSYAGLRGFEIAFARGGFVYGITRGEIGGQECLGNAAEALAVLDDKGAWALRQDCRIVKNPPVGEREIRGVRDVSEEKKSDGEQGGFHGSVEVISRIQRGTGGARDPVKMDRRKGGKLRPETVHAGRGNG